MSLRLTDSAIIAAIHAGGKEIDRALSDLYANGNYKSSVRGFVLKFGGQESEIEDLFQDAIAHLVMNIRKGNFRGDSQLKTYFLTICRNIWFQKMRRLNKFDKISQHITIQGKTNDSPETILLFAEQKNLLQQLLDKIGHPCKTIISLWSLNYSMKEIATKTEYKNQGVVRKKKHQCLQALIKLVHNNKSIMQQLRF